MIFFQKIIGDNYKKENLFFLIKTSKEIFLSEDISFLNKILFNIIIIQNIYFDCFN